MEVIEVKEVAEITGYTVGTVYSKISRGEIVPNLKTDNSKQLKFDKDYILGLPKNSKQNKQIEKLKNKIAELCNINSELREENQYLKYEIFLIKKDK